MRRIRFAMLATGMVVSAMGGARAADLAYKAPPPPPPPAYSWNGLYLGANIGYSWGAARYDSSLVGIGTISRSEKMDGVIGGFQSGYNYQLGAWVLGFESDIQLSAQKGGATFPGILPLTTITTEEKLPWFGTSRTRVGFLMTPSVLLYGTGGVAYGQVKGSATVATTGVGAFTASFSDVKAGLTGGAGVEAAFGGGWSGKLEYLYLDLGKTEHSFGTVALGTIASETRRTTDNIVRVGVNYRWGG